MGERLPKAWNVERSARELSLGGHQTSIDSLISLQAPNGTFATLVVEARPTFSPRDAATLLPRLAQLMRSLSGNTPLLVVARWLSKRSQELLAEQDVNYLDTTGNARIRLDNPPFYLEMSGARKDPEPAKRARSRLTGGRAARLMRLLADVHPPYTVNQLASATGLAPGYVSQLLDSLYSEALIERAPRGPVESVDLAALLRRWAQSYDVLKSNQAYTYVAPAGFEDLLERFVEKGLANSLVLTGSIAAKQLAPVSASAIVMAYCEHPSDVAQQLGLLPADEGANAILLEPFDPVVWDRTTRIEFGLRFAAPSQIAVDCLTGNGRMPAEGDALLTWMLSNESEWRLPSLDAWTAGTK